jgi:hypothetical protein
MGPLMAGLIPTAVCWVHARMPQCVCSPGGALGAGPCKRVCAWHLLACPEPASCLIVPLEYCRERGSVVWAPDPGCQVGCGGHGVRGCGRVDVCMSLIRMPCSAQRAWPLQRLRCTFAAVTSRHALYRHNGWPDELSVDASEQASDAAGQDATNLHDSCWPRLSCRDSSAAVPCQCRAAQASHANPAQFARGARACKGRMGKPARLSPQAPPAAPAAPHVRHAALHMRSPGTELVRLGLAPHHSVQQLAARASSSRPVLCCSRARQARGRGLGGHD